MEKLIFVYNKDGGLKNTAIDFFHKMIKPATYDCSLCMVTYHNFGMRPTWKSFIDALPYESEFYHKDEFLAEFDSISSLPAVFFQKNDTLSTLIDTKTLDNSNLEELMTLVRSRIEEIE